ncbi:MAG: hypothetical protein PHP37_03315 [Patescibacteria group bacterium]|nr:hypothetical protein [Patescibacteria group bacterium]
MFENLKKEHEEKVDDIFADTDQPIDQAKENQDFMAENIRPGKEQPLMDKPLSENKTGGDLLSDFDEDHGPKSKKVLRTIFVVIIILAIIGVAAYFVYSKILAPQALNMNTEKQDIEKQNMSDLFKDPQSIVIEDDASVDVVEDDLIDVSEDLIEEDEIVDPFAALREMDSDIDGLNDYEEIYVHMTDPNNPDTDSDSLSDFDEVMIFGTDPFNFDTDGDSYSDGQEVLGGYNPLGSLKIDPSIFIDQDLFYEKYSDL